MQRELRAGAAVVVKRLLFSILFLSAIVKSQDLPVDEIQATINGYFDNFGVNILYPAVSINKNIGEKTNFNARYMVDVISAASIKSWFKVDGVTSATKGIHGGGDDSPDEIRHEFTAGLTHLFGDISLSLNGIYSTEHDYTSKTLAGSISIPFAKKNTILNFGVVRSWDIVAPQTRFWEKEKNVLSLSADLTQVLSTRLVMQGTLYYSKNDGFLSDAYQVVPTLFRASVLYHEPIHPGTRERKAAGLRGSYLLNDVSSIQLGYRYYTDSWDINSHTINILYQRYLTGDITGSFGIRHYTQSKSFFFKEKYLVPEPLMTVDGKLNEGTTNEFEFKIAFKGESLIDVPVLNNFAGNNSELSFKLNFFWRKTATPDWHSRRLSLFAYITSIGYRFKF